MFDRVNIPSPQDIHLTVLYGSQTGNAEDLARRIGFKVKLLGYNVLVEAMDDFTLNELPKARHVIFVCSTTGHGQEPENMKNFYNFIRRRDLPHGCLRRVKFAVYGLGDSSYSKFNYVSKILFKRLVDCGAQPVHDLVAGDEQHELGCDGSIYPKLEELIHELQRSYNLISNLSTEPDTEISAPQNSYSVILHNAGQGPVPSTQFKDTFISKYNIHTSFCSENKRLTPKSHFQDTRFLCFKTECKLDYEPGDVCTILPANLPENIQQFLEVLGLDPEQRFSLVKKDPNYMVNYLYDFIPDGLKIVDLVTHYLDIQSVPRRSFFEFLWPIGGDNLEQDKLKEFASTEGQGEMYEYCVQPKRSILEVLLDFPNIVKNIKLEHLFDLIPPIKPRSFSIASAANVYPNEIHLIVGVVNYRTRMRKIRRGLCSNYLANLKPVDVGAESSTKSELKFYIKKTAFKLPNSDSTPIIMVGPGLGIAPFRSFIQERALRPKSFNLLYFGCRYENADFYFRDELQQFVAEQVIEVRVSFSREEPKQYVQDLILSDAEIVRKLILHDNAAIYVAGNSKLPEDLRRLIGKLMISHDGDGKYSEEMERLVADLESQNKLQYDCW